MVCVTLQSLLHKFLAQIIRLQITRFVLCFKKENLSFPSSLRLFQCVWEWQHTTAWAVTDYENTSLSNRKQLLEHHVTSETFDGTQYYFSFPLSERRKRAMFYIPCLKSVQKPNFQINKYTFTAKYSIFVKVTRSPYNYTPSC